MSFYTTRAELEAWFRSLFYDDPMCCAVCEESDDDTLGGVCAYASNLRFVGLPVRRVCHGCGLLIANLFTYSHGGRAEFDREGIWPRPVTKERHRQRKISHATAMLIFERDGYACRSCGSQKGLVVDHVIPIAKDGGDEEGNLQTLCGPCNSSKGASLNWTGRKAVIGS